MGERLDLVRSFSELRAGMIVVVKGCGRCGIGVNHRGILVNFTRGADCLATNGAFTTEDTWEVVPAGACGCACIGRYDVEVHRCIYRVVDPGLESSDQETRQTRKSPRKKPVTAGTPGRSL